MRKIAWLLIVSLCFSLAACGDLTEPSTPSSTATAPDTTQPEVPSVTLSAESGVYSQPFSLTLGQNADGQIYYTLDGSDPAISTTAICYSGPIQITDRKGEANVVSAVDPVLISGNLNKPSADKKSFTCSVSAPEDEAVDKCTVIRAVIKLSDGSYSQEVNATYFIGSAEDHIQNLADSCASMGTSLAVISISMNYDDLFDHETGIYVKGAIFEEALKQYLQYNKYVKDGEQARSLDANYKQRGRAWEREAVMTMFEMSPDSTQVVLSQGCGIRIQGNYSRSDLQKGLRLYARTEYGDNNFDYAVFGQKYLSDAGEVMDKFDTLVLRAGGNCAFTSKFNDTFWQSLLEETACDMKHSRPCVVYLNGEYWGLYVLEEDYTDDYFEDLHGVSKDSVVIYKGDAETYDIGYKLDEGELPEGAEEDYYFRELLDFFARHDNLRSDADYEVFCSLVDPASVMDYFAVQCWINNKWDWPGKNWSMWRTTSIDLDNPYADGRWRFLFYDMEFGGVSGKNDAYTNTIKEDNYKPNGLLDMDTGNPAVLCFAYLMTNEGFRNAFYERLSGLSTGIFSQERAIGRLNEMKDAYAPLYDQFFDRYPGTGSTYNALSGGYASIGCIRAFLSERENHIQKMIDYCDKILKG